MVRGIYASASGMIAQQRTVDVVANNLANVNTNGFKKDVAIFRAAPEERFHRLNDPLKLPWVNFIVDKRPYIGWSGSGVKPDEVFTKHQAGVLKQTMNPLDLAIVGEGFFKVETPQGIRYTRDGAFVIDNQDRLTTSTGFLVLGEDGQPITVKGNTVLFATDGTVLVDGKKAGKVQIVQFEEPFMDLKKIGDNLFAEHEGGKPEIKVETPQVLAGYLESSNVNPVQEMVDMITALRAYETSQRMITSQDATVDRVINTVGIVK
jgi:flagellar basal-body rod protein FlgG